MKLRQIYGERACDRGIGDLIGARSQLRILMPDVIAEISPPLHLDNGWPI
jgi:hypothetical protein